MYLNNLRRIVLEHHKYHCSPTANPRIVLPDNKLGCDNINNYRNDNRKKPPFIEIIRKRQLSWLVQAFRRGKDEEDIQNDLKEIYKIFAL